MKNKVPIGSIIFNHVATSPNQTMSSSSSASSNQFSSLPEVVPTTPPIVTASKAKSWGKRVQVQCVDISKDAAAIIARDAAAAAADAADAAAAAAAAIIAEVDAGTGIWKTKVSKPPAPARVQLVSTTASVGILAAAALAVQDQDAAVQVNSTAWQQNAETIAATIMQDLTSHMKTLMGCLRFDPKRHTETNAPVYKQTIRLAPGPLKGCPVASAIARGPFRAHVADLVKEVLSSGSVKYEVFLGKDDHDVNALRISVRKANTPATASAPAPAPAPLRAYAGIVRAPLVAEPACAAPEEEEEEDATPSSARDATEGWGAAAYVRGGH